MKTRIYKYDVVSGLNKRKVIETLFTRQEARNFKNEQDLLNPQVKHRIIQHRYDVANSQEIR